MSASLAEATDAAAWATVVDPPPWPPCPPDWEPAPELVAATADPAPADPEFPDWPELPDWPLPAAPELLDEEPDEALLDVAAARILATAVSKSLRAFETAAWAVCRDVRAAMHLSMASGEAATRCEAVETVDVEDGAVDGESDADAAGDAEADRGAEEAAGHADAALPHAVAVALSCAPKAAHAASKVFCVRSTVVLAVARSVVDVEPVALPAELLELDDVALELALLVPARAPVLDVLELDDALGVDAELALADAAAVSAPARDSLAWTRVSSAWSTAV